MVMIDNETVFYYIWGFPFISVTSYLIRRPGMVSPSGHRPDEEATAFGINVTLLKIVTFSISAFFVGALAYNGDIAEPQTAYRLNPNYIFLVLMALRGKYLRA
jgi:ABC-type branched-subunit amino acid transport system permease subunit